MSARTTPKQREAQARRAAKNMLNAFRRPGRMNAYVVLRDAAGACAEVSAQELNDGNLADARMWARAYRLLDESAKRGYARGKRDSAKAGAR